MVDPDDEKPDVAPASGIHETGQRPVRFGEGEVLLGRFELQAKLGEGGVGRVFAAFDRERSSVVAVKTLGQRTPLRVSLLKHEFRVASELAHPNLVRLYELFCIENDCFFSMERVDGVTLPARLAMETGSRDALLRTLLGQLALALDALHRTGMLHGDLKPSNFLITEGEDRVVLLDFGLARATGPDQKLVLSGTPRYMAPEQERFQVVTEAADWFSFGVVMYEALTGVLPARQPSTTKLSAAAPDLSMLCLGLLQRDPAHRPSGHDVLQTLDVARRARTSTSPPPAPSSLVGRERELAMLSQLAPHERETPTLVFVHGASGIGKTALCEEFVERARAAGAITLTGRCRERESIGFKAVDSLIDDLVSVLQRKSEGELSALSPDDLGNLASLFPALRIVRWIDEVCANRVQPNDGALARTRAAQALAELLSSLARSAPVIVWLDDLQWSDADSAALLGPALGGPHPAPILFVGSYRTTGVAHGPLLHALLTDRTLQLPASSEIALEPLHNSDGALLARSLLPAHYPGAADVARGIQRESGGHPLFIAELAHAAQLTEPALPAGARVTLLDLVRARVQAVPTAARSLLELVAVAGEPLPNSLAASALNLSRVEADEWTHLLRAQRLLRTAKLNAVDVHHDRIREIVVLGIDDGRRKECHRTLARALEGWTDRNPARRAFHYEAGGERTLAARDWIAAGDHSMHVLAFGHAAEMYAKGLELATLEAEARRAVQLRQANALSFAGKGPAAAEVFLAIARTSDRQDAVDFQRRAAEQLLLSGHLDRGLPLAEHVLDTIGMRQTHGGRAAVLPLLAGRAWLRIRGLEYVPATEEQLTRERRLQLDVCWTIARSLSLLDPIRGAEFQARHLALALRTGEPRRLLRALTLEASYSATPGPRGATRTQQLLAAAEAIATTHDDAAARGLLNLAHGIAAYLHGNLEPALARLYEALHSTDGRGAVWERMSAQRLIIASLFTTGRLRELASFVPPLIAETEGMGNLYATASFRTGYSTVAWLAHDRLREADRQLGLARQESRADRFQLVHHNLLLGETFRDLYAREYERAHARMVERWPALRGSMLLQVSLIRVHSLHLRGASAAAAAAVLEARGRWTEARSLRREARQIALKLSADPFPRARPLASLIHAALDWADRRPDSMLARLRASASEFDAQHMQLYAAAARWRAGRALGEDAGREILRSVDETIRAQRLVRPYAVLNMLAPGFGDSPD